MKPRYRVGKAAALFLGVAVALVVGYPLSVSATASPGVTAASLPEASYLTGLTVADGDLFAYGEHYPPGDQTSANPPTCNQGRVNPKTLQLSSLHDVSCTFLVPGIDVVPIEQPLGEAKTYSVSGINTQLRIEQRNPRTGRVVLGPVVMKFPETSDTRPIWTYGAGSLWIYDCVTSTGARLVRVSATTGAVQSTVSAPEVCHPVIAAGKSGFWLGSTTQSPTTATLYHFASGASRSTRISLVGNDVEWIVTNGADTWVDSGQSSQTCACREGDIVRIDGDDLAPVWRVSDADLQSGWGIQAVYGNEALGLWTITPGNAGGAQNPVSEEHVVRINPDSGEWSDVAQVPLALAVSEYQAALGTSAGAIYDGSLFFLEPAELPLNGAAGIVRVTP